MNPKRSYLYGAHVIVTGASDGIGKEIVRLLVGRFNCTVLGIARGEEKLAALKTELGGSFRYIVGDVTDVGLWKNVSADFDREPCSVLINNAGIMPPFTLALGEPDEELRRVFEVNYFAPVTATRMLLPKMKRVYAMPAVVNVCSSSALCPLAATSAYSASKAAVSHLTRIWGNELADYNILVNAICPCYVMTPMMVGSIARKAAELGTDTDGGYKYFADLVPTHRLLEVEEVGNWAAVLCSELGLATTGSNISITCGQVQL